MSILDPAGAAIWFVLLCTALGCALLGFTAGHLVRAERDWQRDLDQYPAPDPRRMQHRRLRPRP